MRRRRNYRKYSADAHLLSDVEKNDLAGPVKQVMTTSYKAHQDGERVVLEKIDTDHSGDDLNSINTYDEKGSLIKKESFGIPFRKEEIFDGEAKKTLELSYYHGAIHTTTTYTYNEQGKLIKSLALDADGMEQFRHEYCYIDTGQSSETLNYYQGKLTGRSVTVYEDKLRTINGTPWRNSLSSTDYKADGSINHESIRTFNDDGKETEHIFRYTDEKQKKWNRHDTHKYNEHGDCIESTYYNPDGSIKHTSTYEHEYDADGKKIEPPRPDMSDFDPYPLKPGETEEFENDHHGNWIKKTFLFKNKAQKVTLRQISYYGEASENQPPFIHIMITTPEEEIEKPQREFDELEPADARWLAEGITNPEIFPLHRYYAMMYNEVPSTIAFNGAYIEALSLLEMLKDKHDAVVIHSAGTVWNGHKERMVRYTVCFNSYPGYVLQAANINEYEEDEYDVPSYISDTTYSSDNVYFGQLQLLRPADSSEKRQEFFEEQISSCIDECTLERKPEKPYINIIETTANGGFVMKEHPVDDDFEINDLDVNYGYGFEDFHNQLMQRFNKSTKGLVLFHGEPGTGKTYYIRHLLRKMVTNKKVVIYMPPNMVDHLTEPGFMTFLAEEVRNWSAEGNFCVLLIEDAEPLLAKRQEGVRIQGVTNLLNLSDGLLNDMLNLQIICTFNVDLRKLDSALLRPGRLVARKEFKALDELDANLLAQRIGIKHHFKGPATLGEIYAMRKNQNTLIHDVSPDRDASTLLDDL